MPNWHTFERMLCDSHTHIYAGQFDEDREEVMQRASEAGVRHLLMPNIDASSINAMHKVADRWPDRCYPMMGLHPCSVQEDYRDQLSVVERHLFEPVRKYIAVGEIGIDLYWDKSTLEIQQEAFRQQIQWAKALKLPIVIHVRESFDEVFEIVDEEHDDRLSGVFHCFTGTLEQAQHIEEYGSFMMGIGGVLTFKNGKIDKFIDQLNPEKLILETDAPYLAPKPYRGKRNEPAYTKLVAERLAELQGIPLEAVATQTTRNCESMFKLDLTNEANPEHFPAHLGD